MTDEPERIIHKSAWIEIQQRKVLFARSLGRDLFYSAGGKREEGETDEEALMREIREELGVELIPNTIVYLDTIAGPAHGTKDGAIVKLRLYRADYTGNIVPQSEIEELGWFSSADSAHTTIPGQRILSWLKERDFID